MATASIHLVLGGTRSGKSAYAENLCRSLARDPAPQTGTAPATAQAGARGEDSVLVYIATAEPFDAEMRARIRGHQLRRGDEWRHVDAPHALADAIRDNARSGQVVLVDCLSVWLGNLFHRDMDIDEALRELLECVRAVTCPLVCVASEVGLGIVPDNVLARRYRDKAGRLNQAVAAVANRVTLVVAGQPLHVKTPG